MRSEFTELREICQNISRPFDFKKVEKVVFVNTGDVDQGRFLNIERKSKIGLPGQAKKAIQKGDILFSEIRPGNGRFALVDFDASEYVVSTKFMVLQHVNHEIDFNYFYKVLTSKIYLNKFQKIAEYRSGTFPQITFDAISHIPFYSPPLHEQKAIAHILGTLDDKIELNRKMNETLEEMAQALFKSWFVDFDPVLDKALDAGNDVPEPLQILAEKRKLVPDSKKLIHTNPELAKEFPNRFTFTDELGWIPEGWEVKPLSSFGDVIGGGTPSTKVPEYFTEKGIPWLSPKDLSGYNWKFISRGDRDISDLGLQKSSARLMPKGTVLFSSRAPIGYLAIARNDISTNQGFKSIVPKETYMSEFLYQFLNFNKDNIESLASGSTFKEVSGKIVKGFPAILPPEEILKSFSNLLESSGLKQQIIQDSSETLEKLRDTLLPKLISGELRVPEARKIVEDHG